jgi:hypothetical protein
MTSETIKEQAKLLGIKAISKRFIIEVVFNDSIIEYRAASNEVDIEKELAQLKKTYKDRKCVFYKGELNIA